MNTNDVGKILFYLRKKLNISQLNLSKGLCSVSHISRIESGERIPDMMLLEALFQRMGKSPDKIEIMLSERDYTLCALRMEIEIALNRKDYELADLQIEYYSREKEAELILHKQYIYKIKAIIERNAKNDITKSTEYLTKAIEITLPDFCYEKIGTYLLSVREIQLLLLLANNYIIGREDEALVLLTMLERYLEKHYTDEEEKVKIYPKVAYLLSKILLKLGMCNKSVCLCRKSIDLLVDSGVIVCLLELLELFELGLEKLNNKRELILVQREIASLKELYKEYGVDLLKNKLNIWQENTQKEIYLVHELIKINREHKNITQEKLTEKIGREQETLSRIETGKRAPNRNTFQSLKEELEIDRNYYTAYISAEEFEIYEKKREISKLIFGTNYITAKQCLEYIKGKISEEIEENKQYILYLETVLNFRLGIITPTEALANYKRALGCTQKKFITSEILSGLLTRQEVFILNNIAIIYQRFGNYKKAILLLEKVLAGFEKSSVDIRFHSVGCLLTIMNLSSYYEEKNDFTKAIDMCKKGIRLSLQCGRGNSITKLLATQAYTLERKCGKNNKEEIKKACLNQYKQAIFISKLLKNSAVSNLLEQHVKINYDTEFI